MHHLLFRGMERIGPDEYERRKNEWSRLLVQEASSGGHETVLLDGKKYQAIHKIDLLTNAQHTPSFVTPWTLHAR